MSLGRFAWITGSRFAIKEFLEWFSELSFLSLIIALTHSPLVSDHKIAKGSSHRI